MSSHEGSPFDQFQWERDDFQTDLERERQRQERQRQGGQQLDLSERLDLAPDIRMGTTPQSLLQTPTLSPAGVGHGSPTGSMTPFPQPMDFSVLAQMDDALMPDAGTEGNAILGNMFPSSAPPVQQRPPLPLTPTPGYSLSTQWHRQRLKHMRNIAKGFINPAGREYLQREFKITEQDVAALIASDSHRSGPPGEGTPSRGPPRGRGTPSSTGPPSGGPPGGGRSGGGGGGDGGGGEGGTPPPSPPGSSGSGGSRRRGGRRCSSMYHRT